MDFARKYGLGMIALSGLVVAGLIATISYWHAQDTILLAESRAMAAKLNNRIAASLSMVWGVFAVFWAVFSSRQHNRNLVLAASEERLREANLKQQEAVRAANVGLWDWNLLTNEVQFSAEWKHQIGYLDEEIGDDFEEWRSRVHPEDLEQTLRQVQLSIDEKTKYHVEFRFRHKDGSYRWILAQGSVLADLDGKPVRMLGSHVDITDLKQSEEYFKMQQQLLKAINAAQNSYIAESSLQEVFDHLLQMLLDLTSSEYGFIGEVHCHPETGQPYLKTYALTNIAWDQATRDFYEQQAPNGLEFHNLNTLFGVSLRSGEVTIANRPETDPRRGGLPAGHPPLKAFMGIPLMIGGRMIGMAGVANRPGGYDTAQLEILQPLLTTIAGIIQAAQVDLERQRAVEELRESKERFQLLLDSTAEAIVGIDSRGDCIFCNRSSLKLLGYADESGLLGLNLREQIHCREDGKNLPEEECLITQALEDGRYVHSGLEYLRRSDGTCFPAEIWGHPIIRGGAPVGAVVSFIDITDRKVLEEQNLRSSQLASVGELAAGVAHEINNPITGIINYAQLLLSGTTITISRDEVLQRIIKEGDRIAGIVRALLHLSRDTRGEFACCQLADVLETVRTLVSAQFDKDDIGIDWRIQPGLPPLMANPQQLEQVVVNLLHNSRYAINEKFGAEREGRLLQVTAEAITLPSSEQVCRLTVYDNGTGIPAELLSKVTNPFVTTKPAGVGTGLGLSLCLEIVNHHRGTLRIESQKGEYTRVVIDLPVTSPQGR